MSDGFWILSSSLLLALLLWSTTAVTRKQSGRGFWRVISCLATLYSNEAIFGMPLVCTPQVALFLSTGDFICSLYEWKCIFTVCIYVCVYEWGHKKWVSECVGGVISLVCTVFVQFFPWQQTACTGRAEGNAALSAKANKGSQCECACVCTHLCCCASKCVSICDSEYAVCFQQMCYTWIWIFICNSFLQSQALSTPILHTVHHTQDIYSTACVISHIMSVLI